MITTAETLSVVVMLVVSTVESRRLCNLRCGPGESCHLVWSTCEYPPCPKMPVCRGSAEYPPEIVNRPGVCPAPTSIGPCVTQCRHDGDCRHQEKCCENGCGRVCRNVQEVLVQKAGSCPWHIQREMLCGRDCDNDHECPGTEKCCNTACGSTCSRPCYHWLRGTGTRFWSLPFNCRRG